MISIFIPLPDKPSSSFQIDQFISYISAPSDHLQLNFRTHL